MIVRFFREAFRWKTVRDTGVFLYQENAVTGRRRVRRYRPDGYQPVNQRWLDGGRW